MCVSFLFSAFVRKVFRSDKYVASYARHAHRNASTTSREVSVICPILTGNETCPQSKIHQYQSFDNLKRSITGKKRKQANIGTSCVEFRLNMR
jgi:hypothetical protein